MQCYRQSWDNRAKVILDFCVLSEKANEKHNKTYEKTLQNRNNCSTKGTKS